MSDKYDSAEKELRQALVNFLGERSNKNLFAFFDLLRTSRVLSPALIDGLSEEQTKELQNSGHLQVRGRLRVKNSCLMVNGKKYLPLFTCQAELQKGPKCNSIAASLSHLQQVVERDPEITALLVDPFSQPNLVIPREKISEVVEGRYRKTGPLQEVTLAAGTRVVQPRPFPQELAGSLYVLLDNLAGVEKAWLLQIDDPERRSWLVVADYHDIDRGTLTAMLTSAAKKHGQGLPLGLLPLESDQARQLVADCDPFFVSGESGRQTLLN
ncbi:MAG: enhanced serine sensitivity protein SseB C-terminal domain-containing protein [Firmicutes bacterium]|nr:enhanced serine sensitivity protein SseB C-terminal domain-containing protein [Bacillota bacterium]